MHKHFVIIMCLSSLILGAAVVLMAQSLLRMTAPNFAEQRQQIFENCLVQASGLQKSVPADEDQFWAAALVESCDDVSDDITHAIEKGYWHK